MFHHARSPVRRGAVLLLAAALLAAPAVARARQPAEIAGAWTLTFDKTGATCRVMLQAARSDRGDYILGMPTACRHAMPGIAGVGRWSVPDDAHVVLSEPGGTPLLTLTAAEDGFVLAGPIGTYALRPTGSGLSAAPAAAAPALAVTPAPTSAPAPAPPPAPAAALVRVAARQGAGEAASPGDLAGRYAVLREKRDTGCMVTLDKAHAKGGDRAQLAPGCRDQGIVVFDPSTWQIVHGDLVLTARAGHKTKLERQDDGVWAKDPKEGGKPLGLKKL